MGNNKLKNKQLSEAVGQIIISIILCGFFGYCGYVFCKDNNYDVNKGIIFGILLPFILAAMQEKFDFGFIRNIIVIIFWIIICEYIPIFVGIIAVVSIIICHILRIVDICRKYKNNETYQIQEYDITTNKTHKTAISEKYKNIDYDLPKEEYYCDRCDKAISEEEYLENGGLCEECDEEVYFGEEYENNDHDMYR